MAPLLVGALALVAVGGVAGADVPPQAQVLSTYETATNNSIGRDCGYSLALPSGQSLWLFCDTPIYNTSKQLIGLILGSTAAEGPHTPGLVPTGLVEVPTPPAALGSNGPNPAPQRFLTNPSDVYLQDGSGQLCQQSTQHPKAYPAAWPSGMALEPGTSTVLIMYDEVCVEPDYAPRTISVEGLGIGEYDSVRNVITRNSEILKPASSGAQLPAQEQLGSPVFKDTHVYFVSGECLTPDGFGGCKNGNVYLARVAAVATRWGNAAKYTWWESGSPTWTPVYSSAGNLLAGASQGPKPLNASVVTLAHYPGHGLVILEQSTLGGAYETFDSASGAPTGPWTNGSSGSGLAGCNGNPGLCHAPIGHPDISTTSKLLMSYFDPDITTTIAGHVEVTAINY